VAAPAEQFASPAVVVELIAEPVQVLAAMSLSVHRLQPVDR
jgi:hypothetical protein